MVSVVSPEKKNTLMADVVLQAASERIFDRPHCTVHGAGQATPLKNLRGGR